MLFLLNDGDDKLIEKMVINYCCLGKRQFLEEQFVQEVLKARSSLKLVGMMKKSLGPELISSKAV